MNAILQSLFVLVPFSTDLLTVSELLEAANDNNNNSRSSSTSASKERLVSTDEIVHIA